MKIKTDFITNSSTTVQIVHVPNKLTISKEDVKRLDDYKELPLDELYDKVTEILDELKGSGSYSPWDHVGGAFYVITQYLDEKGLSLKSMDVGGSEGTYIVNISERDIQNLIATVASSELTSLFDELKTKGEPISQGDDDVKTIEKN